MTWRVTADRGVLSVQLMTVPDVSQDKLPHGKLTI